jgi:hypothetical protein
MAATVPRSAAGCRRTPFSESRPRPPETRHSARGDDLRADLSQLLLLAGQRPVFDRLGRPSVRRKLPRAWRRPRLRGDRCTRSCPDSGPRRVARRPPSRRRCGRRRDGERSVAQVDPLAGKFSKSGEVHGRRKPLRLEAAHLARRSRTALSRFATDYPAHRGIMPQAFAAVHVLVAGDQSMTCAEYKSTQPVVVLYFSESPSTLPNFVSRHIHLCKRVRGDPGLPITTNRRRVVFNRHLSGECRINA